MDGNGEQCACSSPSVAPLTVFKIYYFCEIKVLLVVRDNIKICLVVPPSIVLGTTGLGDSNVRRQAEKKIQVPLYEYEKSLAYTDSIERNSY